MGPTLAEAAGRAEAWAKRHEWRVHHDPAIARPLQWVKGKS
jgi:hypothetical protein